MIDQTKEFILGTFVFGVCLLVIAFLVTEAAYAKDLVLSLAAIPALYLATKLLGEQW